MNSFRLGVTCGEERRRVRVKRKRQAGQAFILVLILLAIGAMLVVPALRLTSTSLNSSQIVTGRARSLYAADAMQEYVMWKLLYDGYASQFQNDGDVGYLSIDVCGVSANATIVMRAVEGQGGITLATDDAIQPTKSVSPSTVPNDSHQVFTYIIRLEQLSNNTTQGLDAIYDILPKDFGTGKYVTNSSYLRVDGGTWQSIGDPLVEAVSNQDRLRWPNPNTYGSENFTSPIRDFAVRQVKELKFQIALTLPSPTRNSIQVNWVVLKPWNTVSGPQAPITVGTAPNPPVYSDNGLLYVGKTSYPEIVQPGVEADIEYTITLSNQDGGTHQISQITDYLPPEFYYSANTTSGNITTANPTATLKNINGVNRQELVWVLSAGQRSIAAGQTKTLIFWARTTKDVSGSYYNEVTVEADFPVPTIFAGIGVTSTEYKTGYSWNTGTVIVPAYDSSTGSGGVTIDANLALSLGSMSIFSYQVR